MILFGIVKHVGRKSHIGADPELFINGGWLQSCFSDSVYNQSNFPT